MITHSNCYARFKIFKSFALLPFLFLPIPNSLATSSLITNTQKSFVISQLLKFNKFSCNWEFELPLESHHSKRICTWKEENLENTQAVMDGDFSSTLRSEPRKLENNGPSSSCHSASATFFLFLFLMFPFCQLISNIVFQRLSFLLALLFFFGLLRACYAIKKASQQKFLEASSVKRQLIS